ncbi:hypothetical protein [Ellagibacter isourolithinifaciens]|uniref:hypothetical protein n=1 Tax=Ellagibacter isourolithinifaciens TaxID=2137581 RepID=UPI003A9006B2
MGVIEASDRAWKVVQMKGEKQGVSAWLRGIIGECGVSGTRSCAAIAEAFGIDCKHERTCRDCITKMMTAITDRIDAERELPADVEWPRFEDGELVKMGDEVGFEGETMRVCEVALDADGWVLWCENDGLDGRLRGSYVERVKHPAPEVLDADGVPIKVGDTVWATYNGCKHIVMAVCSDGSLHPEMVTDDGCMVEYEEGLWDFAKKVTHEQPDSWILWGEDLDMAVKVGEVDKAEMMCRAKALAKGECEWARS